jgi:hypothetical protein
VPLGAITSSAAAVASAPRQRVWHPAARTALPPEPGRLQTNALVNVARHARGCCTRGDDRLETRAYAVKRLLWRWGHAERSGHYARSIWQLIEGLAPIMGWGPVPGRDDPGRQRWLRTHAANVRRWLSDLQAAGIISYTGETDNLGMDWRTLITLHQASDPPPEQLQAARQRMAAWGRRRRAAARRQRDRQCRRRRGRRLEAIRRNSHRPTAAVRRRLAITRDMDVRERRQVASAAERQLARYEQSKLRTHHPGSSNSVGALRAPHASHQLPAPASETGAHARGYAAVGVRQTSPTDCTEREGCVASAMVRDHLIKERVAARATTSSWCRRTAAGQALQRARELLTAAPGRIWPPGRLREAWVVYRYGTAIRDDWLTPDSGPERVGDHGASDAGTRGHGQQHRATTAIALYEQHADHRPPGWPRAGAAALCVLAALRRADTLEGDIARLLVLAKDMRACTLVDDAERRARITRRASARARATPGRLAFRCSRPARWETIELRRRKLRDELLLAGKDPSTWTINAAIEHRADSNLPTQLVGADVVDQELDGARSRQLRYADELRIGRWDLPPT